jgi:hypothetical protein
MITLEIAKGLVALAASISLNGAESHTARRVSFGKVISEGLKVTSLVTAGIFRDTTLPEPKLKPLKHEPSTSFKDVLSFVYRRYVRFPHEHAHILVKGYMSFTAVPFRPGIDTTLS